MFEGPIKPRLKVRKFLFIPLTFRFGLLGSPVKTPRDCINSLKGACRVRWIEIGLICLFATNEDFGVAVFEHSCSAGGRYQDSIPPDVKKRLGELQVDLKSRRIKKQVSVAN